MRKLLLLCTLLLTTQIVFAQKQITDFKTTYEYHYSLQFVGQIDSLIYFNSLDGSLWLFNEFTHAFDSIVAPNHGKAVIFDNIIYYISQLEDYHIQIYQYDSQSHQLSEYDLFELHSEGTYAKGHIYYNKNDVFYAYDIKNKKHTFIKNGASSITKNSLNHDVKALESDFSFLGLLTDGKFITMDLSEFPKPVLQDFIKLKNSYLFSIKHEAYQDPLKVYKLYSYKDGEIKEIANLDTGSSYRFVEDEAFAYVIETQTSTEGANSTIYKIKDNQILKQGEAFLGPFYQFYAYVLMQGHTYSDYSNMLIDNEKIYFIGNSSSNIPQLNKKADLSLYIYDLDNNSLTKKDANILNSNISEEDLSKGMTNIGFKLNSINGKISIRTGTDGFGEYLVDPATLQITKSDLAENNSPGFLPTLNGQHIKILPFELILSGTEKSDSIPLPTKRNQRGTFLKAYPGESRIWLLYNQIGKIAYFVKDKIDLIELPKNYSLIINMWESATLDGEISLLALQEYQDSQSYIHFLKFSAATNTLENIFTLTDFYDLDQLKTTYSDGDIIKIELGNRGQLTFDLHSDRLVSGFQMINKTDGIMVFELITGHSETLSRSFTKGILYLDNYYFVNSDGFHIYSYSNGIKTIEPLLTSGSSPDIFRISKEQALVFIQEKKFLVNLKEGSIEQVNIPTGYHFKVSQLIDAQHCLLIKDYRSVLLFNVKTKNITSLGDFDYAEMIWNERDAIILNRKGRVNTYWKLNENHQLKEVFSTTFEYLFLPENYEIFETEEGVFLWNFEKLNFQKTTITFDKNSRYVWLANIKSNHYIQKYHLDENQYEVIVYDSETESSIPLFKSFINPSIYLQTEDKVFFRFMDEILGWEIAFTDGKDYGFYDINTGKVGSNPRDFFKFQGEVYATAVGPTSTGHQLFLLDKPEVHSILLSKEITTLNFNLYPNPTQGYLNITSAVGDDTKYKITVIDIVGRKLQENRITLPYRLDLTKLTAGMYLINVQSANENRVFRIVKVD